MRNSYDRMHNRSGSTNYLHRQEHGGSNMASKASLMNERWCEEVRELLKELESEG